MSGLGFNKVAGASLATLLIIFGVNEASSMYFEPHELEKPGYAVEPLEDTGGPANAGPDLPPDWGTALPAADVAAGQALFAKCKSCHKLTDANGTGPGLVNVVGRKPATMTGFKYSTAMMEHAQEMPMWDYDRLYEFLAAPKKVVPGTKMGFAGLKKAQDRINIIAYLHSTGSSLGMPAPDPARQAALAAAAAGTAPAGAAVATATPAAGTAPAVSETKEGQPTATGETAQAGQPAQAPTTGPAKAPTQATQVKGSAGGSTSPGH